MAPKIKFLNENKSPLRLEFCLLLLFCYLNLFNSAKFSFSFSVFFNNIRALECIINIFSTVFLSLQDQYDNLAIHTQKGIDFLDKYGSFIRDRSAIEVEYAAKLR